MKIIVIGTAYPYKGGLASFNERLALELQQMGHEVEIITFTLQYPSFLFPGKSQYATESGPETLKISRKIHALNPLNWLKVGRQIRKQHPDLVLIKFWLPFMGPAFGQILRKAKKNGHSRVISILDNVIPHEHRPGDKKFTRYFLKPVDGFVSMSRQVLNDLRLFEKQKPAILSPHPVYDNYGEVLDKQQARKKLQLPEDGKLLLFFGYIRKYKGLDLLIEAMSDERIKKAGIKLIIAGEYYGDEVFYNDLIKKLSVQDRLYLFTDFIPNQEVKYYFSAADCVVQPYRSATQSGISQIAYHFEKPMIVTRVGGLPEIVKDGETGLVVGIAAKEIADAILNFYEKGLAESFVQPIRAEKRKYSWAHFAGNILQLYGQLLKTRQ